MEKLIRDVTKKYTDILPGDVSYFTPGELSKYDIPEFLIQRIEVEIYQNLNDSIDPPHSEWADMAAGNVQQAWEQFITAVKSKVRMPASYAEQVFETSVADVAELILQPQTSVPLILFGSERVRTLDELKKRKKFITVNTHLVDAVLKFMKRKEMKTLELLVCRKVVKRVDDRLTQNYGASDWLNLLQPLFILTGPKVDPELLRLYFEERGMEQISRRIGKIIDPIDKSELVELLNSMKILKAGETEEDQQTLFDESSASATGAVASGSEEKSTNSPVATDHEPEEIKDEFEEKDHSEKLTKKEMPSESAEKHEESEPETDSDTLLTSFQYNLNEDDDIEDEESDEITYADQFRFDDSEEPEPDEDVSLHSRFISDDEEDEKPEGSFQPDDEIDDRDSTSKPDDTFSEKFQFAGKETAEEKEQEEIISFDDEKKEPEAEVQDEQTEEEDEAPLVLFETEDEIDPESEAGESEDRPIWQAFLADEEYIDDDDIEETGYSSFAKMEAEEDDPIMRALREKEAAEEKEVKKLIGWLESDEQRFTDAIFSGSDRAYEQALVKLDDFDNWKQASNYIEKEIFARNFVDMYNEDAVDFTDRMQAYFNKFKS